jgi:hypothetical protein
VKTLAAKSRHPFTMTKSDDSVQSIKYYWRIDHLVVVKFSEVLGFCDSSLVIFEIVLFQPDRYLLKDIVHYANNKLLMVTVKGTCKDGEKVDVAILDLPRFGEYFLQYRDNLVSVSDCQ